MSSVADRLSLASWPPRNLDGIEEPVGLSLQFDAEQVPVVEMKLGGSYQEAHRRPWSIAR